eukprot:4349333-Pleurochrysis_carterae.AAC.1
MIEHCEATLCFQRSRADSPAVQRLEMRYVAAPRGSWLSAAALDTPLRTCIVTRSTEMRDALCRTIAGLLCWLCGFTR